MRCLTSLSGLLPVLVAINGVHAAVASSATNGPLILEELPLIPPGWDQGPSVSAAERLHFRIAVKHRNAFEFEQHVLDISTPDHARYGHHMSNDELKAMLRPSRDTTAAIQSWLRREGIPATDIQDKGDWINFYVSAAEAERMLDTKFHHYTHVARGLDEIRTLRYSVPLQLHEYIQTIQPTTRFGDISPNHLAIGPARDVLARRDLSSGVNVTSCNITITPQCLRDLYRVTGYEAGATEGNTIGVAGFLDLRAKYDDFAKFAELYAPYVGNQTFEYELINGGLSTQDDHQYDIEANLDVQYALALSHPAKATFYSTGGLGELVPDLDQPNRIVNQNEPYLDFLHYLLALPDEKLPTTLSISYGESEQSVPQSYANRTCNLFAQLGARGVSVVFSSGNTGVGSACQTNDGKNTTRFLPSFPASCPFVTSVGGTYFVEPEHAAPFSAGGFSDLFPRPAYQDAAVTEYLSTLGDTWKGLYNPAGRGFPDVAAQSIDFKIIDQGKEALVSESTSGSAAVFAGIISLLNGARISSGQPPLGFLNPFIYSVGYQGLNDIVDGGSTGCTGFDLYSGLQTPFVPFAGWNATKGWDPVTGYGTPDFRKLLSISQRYQAIPIAR